MQGNSAETVPVNKEADQNGNYHTQLDMVVKLPTMRLGTALDSLATK